MFYRRSKITILSILSTCKVTFLLLSGQICVCAFYLCNKLDASCFDTTQQAATGTTNCILLSETTNTLLVCNVLTLTSMQKCKVVQKRSVPKKETSQTSLLKWRRVIIMSWETSLKHDCCNSPLVAGQGPIAIISIC